jgi:uncharacterized membrane protein YraQ (UPF0718 family)
MKIALLFMLVPLAIMLIVIAYTRRFGPLWTASLGQAQGLLPILLLAVLFAACVEVLLPGDLIGRWLGESSGLRGIAIAWLAGILTPGGGPIGLTLVAAVVRQGASMPVVLTYLVSLATLSLIRMPLEVAILGGRLTLLRVLFCLLLPPLVGLAARALRL